MTPVGQVYQLLDEASHALGDLRRSARIAGRTDIANQAESALSRMLKLKTALEIEFINNDQKEVLKDDSFQENNQKDSFTQNKSFLKLFRRK